MNKSTLYNDDCLEAMKAIPDYSVDSIICDPPFGTTSLGWDSVIDLELLWEQLKRIRKPYAPIVLFGVQPFTTTLINSNKNELKYCLVWEKTKAGNFQQAPNMPLRKHEDIIVFSDGVVGHKAQTKRRMTYNPQGTMPTNKHIKKNKVDDPHGYYRENGVYKGYDQTVENYPGTVLKFGSAFNPPHPTQKPIDLMAWLVNSYSDEGDIVLDFSMGSGSTGVAALQNNRNFIGIEKHTPYFDLANSRISDILNTLEVAEWE